MLASILLPMWCLSAARAEITGDFTFLNATESTVVVAVQVTDRRGKLKRNDSFPVDPAKTAKEPTPLVKSYRKLPRGGKVEMSYAPVGSATSVTVKPYVLPDVSSNQFQTTISMSGVRAFDEESSVELLKQLASNALPGPGQALAELYNIQPRLGSLIVANEVNGNFEVLDVFPLTESGFIPLAPTRVSKVVTIDSSVMSKVGVTVPIYGQLVSSLSTGGVYQLNVVVEHFEWTNNFSPATALSIATKEQKAQILSALKQNPNAQIFRIGSMHVVSSAVFSLVRGKMAEGAVDASFAGVFTSNGAFSFHQEDESITALSDVVWGVVYTKYGDRATLIDALTPVVVSMPSESSLLRSANVLRELSEERLTTVQSANLASELNEPAR